MGGIAPHFQKGDQMTLDNIISEIVQFNKSKFEIDRLISLISDIDERIYNDIIKTHEGAPESGFIRYDSPEYTGNGVLLVSDAYSALYRHYCDADIYLTNGENDRYNQSLGQFSAVYNDFAAYYNRTHMPIGTKIKYF